MVTMENKEKNAVKLEDKALEEVSGGLGFEFMKYDSDGTFAPMICVACGSHDVAVVDGIVVCQACGKKEAATGISYLR